MNKEEFIKNLKKKPKNLEYNGKNSKGQIKCVFTNFTKKGKEWYGLDWWSNYDDTSKLPKLQKSGSLQTYSIYDIVEDFIRHS